MKIAAIAFNTFLTAFTLLVLLSGGIEGRLLVFAIWTLSTPILSAVVLWLNGTSLIVRLVRFITIGCNIVLLGLTCWTLVDHFPGSGERGVFVYIALIMFSAAFSILTIMRRAATSIHVDENVNKKEIVVDSNDSAERAFGFPPMSAETQKSERVFAAYPSFWQAILLLLTFLCFQGLLTIPFMMSRFHSHPVALAIPMLFSAIICSTYAYKKSGALFCEVFPFKATGMFVLSALLLMTLGLYRLLYEIAILVCRVLPPHSSFLKFMEDALGGRQSFWGSFWVLVCVAPIVEEMLFRGVILNGFMKRYDHRKAILVSAFLFALMHGNPWQFFTAFCLGVFLGFCFVKTHSLFTCMFAHSINNLLAFIYSLLQQQSHIELLRTMQSNPYYRLGWDAIGLIFAVSGFLMLKKSGEGMDSQMKLKLDQI
jgi:uncharacterized protein